MICVTICGCQPNMVGRQLSHQVYTYRADDQFLAGETTYTLRVPTIKQARTNLCGPTAFYMLLKYWKANADVNLNIHRNIPHNALDLVTLAVIYDLKYFVFKGDMKILKHNIKHTRPLITLLRLPTGFHFVVVRGLVDNGDVIINDPVDGVVVYDKNYFDLVWSKSKRFALLLLPR